MYLAHKLLAYLIGAIIYSLPTPITKAITKGSKGYTIGCTAPNKTGDFDSFYDFKAKYIRIDSNNLAEVKNFAELAGMWGFKYFVLTGETNQSDLTNAQLIATIDDMLVNARKPEFYALINEVNEEAQYNNTRVTNTIKLLASNYGKTNLVVTRGAHTSITESAGIKVYFEYFKGTRQLLVGKPHLIHFYLKPGNGLLVKLENFQRKAMLAYMLFRLRLKGIPSSSIIIDEAHDAGLEKELVVGKTELQPYSNNGRRDGDLIIEELADNKFKVIRYAGDFVFATKEGWQALEKMVDKLGIPVIMYYSAPFLNYKGNTVLEK